MGRSGCTSRRYRRGTIRRGARSAADRNRFVMPAMYFAGHERHVHWQESRATRRGGLMDFYINSNPAVYGLGNEVPTIPHELLARHGARVQEGPGARRATAYRWDALRIPRSVDRT